MVPGRCPTVQGGCPMVSSSQGRKRMTQRRVIKTIECLIMIIPARGHKIFPLSKDPVTLNIMKTKWFLTVPKHCVYIMQPKKKGGGGMARYDHDHRFNSFLTSPYQINE